MKENKKLERDDVRKDQKIHGQMLQKFCNNFYSSTPTIGGLT